MKLLMLLATLLMLNSCNTMIGMGRDGRQAYDWTRSKFQGNSGGGDYQSGAPIY